jgi:hypothetical protein
MAIEIEKNISALLESQFPELYREEGDKFIAFIQAYYEWMEQQNQVAYHTRNLPEYRDIDKTIDEFIIDFKNKYLPNVQFNTATNKQLFIKNALDFYRAKGTERAVDLFFKLIYGLEARVYYPADDLFKLSDNTWLDTQYLELKPNKNNINFVGEQVFGSVSTTSAFAERLVRVKKDNQYIEVLYITDVTGNFKTGERISTQLLTDNYSARIDGSLSAFEITFSSPNFSSGEQVYVSDGKGKKAKAVVSKTADYIGVVNFTLIDGGWGYTNQAEIIGSDKVIQLNDIVFNDDKYFYNHDPSYVFDKIEQDLVTIKVDITNTDVSDVAFSLNLNEIVEVRTNDDPAGNVEFEGHIVYSSSENNVITLNYNGTDYPRNSNGEIIVDGRSLFGNSIPTFYASNNSIEIPVNQETTSAVIDAKAEANVIAWDDKFTIEYSNEDQFSLVAGDILYQEDPKNFLRYTEIEVSNTYVSTVNGLKYANVVRNVGWPRNDQPLFRQETISRTAFTLTNVSNAYAGVVGVEGELQADNYIFNNANTYNANTGMTSGSIDQFGFNTVAKFDVFEYEEEQSLRDWDSVEIIDDLPKVFPGGAEMVIDDFDTLANTSIWDTANSEIQYISEGTGPTEFANTLLSDFLNISDEAVEIGSLKSIVVTDPGQGYSRSPYYVVFEPRDYHMERYDLYFRYRREPQLKAFRINEIITTPTGDPLARARILKHKPLTGEIWAVRLNVSSDITDNSHIYTERDFRRNDIITGENSGVSASVYVVDETRMMNRVGLNSDILSEAFSGEGFVTDLRILNSGFGYFGKRFVNGVVTDGEVLTLISSEDSNRSVSAYGYLGKQGIGEGSWPSKKSFLSTDKYLQDNNFYQEYSYQVLTALPFDKYKQTLIEILHVAGSKPFGGYVGTQEENVNITATGTSTEYNIKQFGLFVNENTFYPITIS